MAFSARTKKMMPSRGRCSCCAATILREVIEGIHAKVAELNERLKAQDVKIVPYIDRADLVDATIDRVGETIFQGIGLVLVVLILFLGSARSALIIGLTIPFAMVTAFILMFFQYPRQPALTRRHRFRHHRRWRDRDDRSDPAPARGEAERSR